MSNRAVDPVSTKRSRKENGKGVYVWFDRERKAVIMAAQIDGSTVHLGLDRNTVQSFLHGACGLLGTHPATAASAAAPAAPTQTASALEDAAGIQSSPDWRRLELPQGRYVPVAVIDICTQGPVPFLSFIARQAPFGAPPLVRIPADRAALMRLVMMLALGSAYGGWDLDVPEWLFDLVQARAEADAALDQVRLSRL